MKLNKKTKLKYETEQKYFIEEWNWTILLNLSMIAND